MVVWSNSRPFPDLFQTFSRPFPDLFHTQIHKSYTQIVWQNATLYPTIEDFNTYLVAPIPYPLPEIIFDNIQDIFQNFRRPKSQTPYLNCVPNLIYYNWKNNNILVTF